MKHYLLITVLLFSSFQSFTQVDSLGNKTNKQEIKDNQKNVDHNDNFPDGMNQDPEMKQKKKEVNSNTVKNLPKTDCVMLYKGNMIIIKNGESTLMDHDITMENGTRVSSDGSMHNKTGISKKMNEGEYINMKGDLFNIENTDKPYIK